MKCDSRHFVAEIVIGRFFEIAHSNAEILTVSFSFTAVKKGVGNVYS
jgi:hypothetical protein